MELIEKAALVAEVNKRIFRNKKRKEWEDIPEKRHQLIIEGQLLGELKYFLDTLEVKEVQEEPVSEDLEEEIIRYIGFPQEVDEDVSTTMIRKAAHHFANWQKEQLEKERKAK